MGILLFLLSYLFFVDPVTSSAGPTYTPIHESLLNWFWKVSPEIKALGYDCHYTSAPGSSNPCHASFYVAEQKCFGLYVNPNTARANWQTTEDDKKKQLGGNPKIDAAVEKQLVYETMRHYFNNGGAMTDIGKTLFSEQHGGLNTKYNSVIGDMIPKVKGDSVDLSNIIPKPASSSSSSSQSGGVQGISLDEYNKKIGKENGQATNQQSETNKLHSQKMDKLVDLIFGGEKRIDQARFFKKFTGIPDKLVEMMWKGCKKLINDELPALNFKMWLDENWKAEETSELGTAIDAILAAGSNGQNNKGKRQKNKKAEISATFANNAIPTAMMLPMVVFSVTLTVFYVYYTLSRKDEVHISLLDENYYA